MHLFSGRITGHSGLYQDSAKRCSGLAGTGAEGASVGPGSPAWMQQNGQDSPAYSDQSPSGDLAMPCMLDQLVPAAFPGSPPVDVAANMVPEGTYLRGVSWCSRMHAVGAQQSRVKQTSARPL